MIDSVGNKTLDARILEVLKKENGFSTDDLGTYFYKDVIKYIVYSLIEIRSYAHASKKRVFDMDMSLLINPSNECSVTKDELYDLIYRRRIDSENDLKVQLERYHSSIYFYVASKINDIDLDSFHKNIKNAAFKTEFVKENSKYENSYMFLAFGLGECILMAIEHDLESECCLLRENLQKLEEQTKMLQIEKKSGINVEEIQDKIVAYQKEIIDIKKKFNEKENLKNALASSREEDSKNMFVSSLNSKKRKKG